MRQRTHTARLTTSAADIDTNLLPPKLQEFVRLIGLSSTMALVQVYGGLRIFIPSPAYVSADHPIAKIIGVDKLMALSNTYGQEDHFPLPMAMHALKALRNQAIAHDYRYGKSARELAIEYGMSEKTIQRITSKMGATPDVTRREGQQHALF
jgi:hypothetical protein